MPPPNTQANRPIAVTTPLGPDKLLLEKVVAREAISEFFQIDLSMLAESQEKIAFDRLLGQSVTVELKARGLDTRYFHGIICRFSEHEREDGPEGPNTFIRYQAQVVPKIWLLTRTFKSRIFQQLKVEEILKVVFEGHDVKYDLKGKYEPRDYCVQYRESDFDFAARLMEEEGIFFYFKHTENSHQMTVADHAQIHPELGVPNGKVKYLEAGDSEREDERVLHWHKTQSIGIGKIVLGDYHFEMPEKKLSYTQLHKPAVKVGVIEHKLKLATDDLREHYEYPGRFAQRFDGIDNGGSPQSSALQKLPDDGTRTIKLRMEEAEIRALEISGKSDCRLFCPGQKFELEEHFNANGKYLISQVEHSADITGTYSTGNMKPLKYSNSFRCIPFDLPFRPQRKTPRPRIDGTQTAVVVGPKGNEIFTDKYSRVKVQFHWDRDGKYDAGSSCWVRVATNWAGRQWGVIHIPRIGQEVVVAFEEGDVDQPIVVGSVYNAANMPPYALPDNATQSGFLSRSSLKGEAEDFNQLRFEDKKGEEDIYFHAQKDFHRVVEHENDLLVCKDGKNDKYLYHLNIVDGNKTETLVKGNETFTIEEGNRSKTLKKGNDSLTLDEGSREQTLKKGNDSLTLKQGDYTHTLDQGNYTLELKMGDQTVKITGNRETTINNGNDTVKVPTGKVTIEAMQGIDLKVGPTSVQLTPSGVTIKGATIKIEGMGMVQVQSPMTTVSGDGVLALKGGVTMLG